MATGFQEPQFPQRFSSLYLLTAQPGVTGIGNSQNLIMDLELPLGGVNNDNLFGAQGSGTTNATSGDTTAITHGIGVVPQPSDIILTPSANGAVYLDTANPPTATTFNVLGSADSLTFYWKIVTNGPGNQ